MLAGFFLSKIVTIHGNKKGLLRKVERDKYQAL